MRDVRKYRNKRGQAVIELAVFGAFLLLLFGGLVSFFQLFNDRQYVQMEAFRRALQKACTYQGATDDGAGASSQVTLFQHRKHVDLSGGFRKGNTQILSASSSVFWAVPKVGGDADSLLTFRVDDQEVTHDYEHFVPPQYQRYDKEGNERAVYRSFEPMAPDTTSDIVYNEVLNKNETSQGITTTRGSSLKETVSMTIPYQVVEKHSNDDDYEKVVEEGTLMSLTEGVYLGSDGQYKYSPQAVGTEVTRSRTWKTNF